jgi:hypothetical protein
MKKKLIDLFKVSLFTIGILFISSCSVSDPSSDGYSIDPNVKITLIVICSIVSVCIVGYGIYFYIKRRKEDKNKLK